MEFTRIVYIDADCIVLGNIDELFDLTPRDEEIFAASPDVFPPDKFNAGVMVITPNEDLFALLVVASSNLTSYDDGDTGLLNAFFHMWYNTESIEIQALRNKLLQYHPQFPEVNQSKIKLIRLPFGYNAQRTMHHFTKANPRYWKSISPLKVIHFCSSPKPWESGLGSKLCGELERLWWEAFMS
jgi:glycogenin glucosyltransferase